MFAVIPCRGPASTATPVTLEKQRFGGLISLPLVLINEAVPARPPGVSGIKYRAHTERGGGAMLGGGRRVYG